MIFFNHREIFSSGVAGGLVSGDGAYPRPEDRGIAPALSITHRVQKLKVSKLANTDTQAVLEVHCSTTREESDADLGEQIVRVPAGDLRSLSADKGYNKQVLREALSDLGIRLLIKNRTFAPYDYAHNAKIDTQRYNQHSMTETVDSAMKRSHGEAERARS